MPQSEIPSIAITINPISTSVTKLAKSLRISSPSVVGSIEDSKLRLDLRTVFEHQDEALVSALSQLK